MRSKRRRLGKSSRCVVILIFSDRVSFQLCLRKGKGSFNVRKKKMKLGNGRKNSRYVIILISSSRAPLQPHRRGKIGKGSSNARSKWLGNGRKSSR